MSFHLEELQERYRKRQDQVVRRLTQLAAEMGPLHQENVTLQQNLMFLKLAPQSRENAKYILQHVIPGCAKVDDEKKLVGYIETYFQPWKNDKILENFVKALNAHTSLSCEKWDEFLDALSAAIHKDLEHIEATYKRMQAEPVPP